MSLISEELAQIKEAPGAFNKFLLLIVTGRLTALLALVIAAAAVALLGVAMVRFPDQSSGIITWLGVIGSAMGLGSQATSLGHSALNKLKGPDHVHTAGGEMVPLTPPASA